ncbi:ATP-binding protein [Rheinheimera baltica]|uniref:ATP-binding protein n=1 Tax=Rheinheimera baltica TaxID=67576 RepID=UPI00273DD564|nr:ATP-binding protein [Rheinheimera baltica]MDP5142739.1 ATP-binding protein [Rheinheimera baltica]MDP5149586.1 ATP-binding protein [Rheinheimera baltica]MDP5189327.1 ATP-binding protein [Rheinheimera baltica]
MLKLSLSLMLSAVCALFVLGAMLDSLAGQAEPHATADEKLLPVLLAQLAEEANQSVAADLPSFAAEQSLRWQLQVSFEPLAHLALPEELKYQLYRPQGLSLAASEHRYLLKALTAHPQWLLKVQLPAEPEPLPGDLWLTLLFYAGICLLMLFWLTPLTRQLWLLSQATKRFGQGDLKTRLSPSPWSYIPALEHSFNQMADQITQLLADNQLLASSLSHDLRTPLACFRFGLDAAQECEHPQQKDHYLQRLEQDLDRMEAMVNAFLEYAGLSRQQQKLRFSAVELLSCCAQVASQCQLLLQQQHKAHPKRPLIQLTLQLPEQEIWLSHANAHWLQRALLNILHNASRYAERHIVLSIQEQAHEIWLNISDDGPGIAEVDTLRIFQPFVRLDTDSATAETPQFGLGLAIVHRVASWHNGRVCVNKSAAGGACFSLQLPRVPLG